MIGRLFSLFFLLPFTLVLIIFATSNRGVVAVSLWPLPYEVMMPLYVIIFVPLVVGFFAGIWYSVWKRLLHKLRQKSPEPASRTSKTLIA